MRIAISGSAGVGKSTLIKAFKRRWPMYSFPVKTYREVITEMNLEHSSNTNEDTQLIILDWMLREQDKFPLGSKVIYDRCPWDCLAYTLQANSNNLISDEVTAAVISLVRESMKGLDLIFWIGRDPSIKLVADGMRDINQEFVDQTDMIFKDLFHQYAENLESDIFLPKEDCPAIMMVEGSTVDDRLGFISEFINQNGELIETENSILDPANVDLLEQMIGEQMKQGLQEDQMKRVIESFKNAK